MQAPLTRIWLAVQATIQEEEPAAEVKPEAQLVHDAAAAAEKVPAGHVLHTALPALEDEPAEQSVHELEPIWVVNLPAAQFVQAVTLPPEEKVPAEQAVQG